MGFNGYTHDLVSIRTKKKRTEIMHELRNFAKYGACCNRALFPNQHNISSYTETTLSAINSRILNGFPSSLRLTTSREKIALLYPPGTQKPIVITRNTPLKKIDEDFGTLNTVPK